MASRRLLRAGEQPREPGASGGERRDALSPPPRVVRRCPPPARAGTCFYMMSGIRDAVSSALLGIFSSEPCGAADELPPLADMLVLWQKPEALASPLRATLLAAAAAHSITVRAGPGLLAPACSRIDCLSASPSTSSDGGSGAHACHYALLSLLQEGAARGELSFLAPHDRPARQRLLQLWLSSPLRVDAAHESALDALVQYISPEAGQYFDFLATHTRALLLPAIIALAALLLPALFDAASFSGLALATLCVAAWSLFMVGSVRDRAAALTWRWRAREDWVEGVRFGYSLEGEWLPLLVRCCGTAALTGLCLVGAIAVNLGFVIWGDAVEEAKGSTMFISILAAIAIAAMSAAWDFVAPLITALENQRTESAQSGSNALKLVLFNAVAAYSSLFYILYFRADLPRLQSTLATLFVASLLIGNLVEVGVPWASGRWKARGGEAPAAAGASGEAGAAARPAALEGERWAALRVDVCLPPFDGLFSEYSEIFVQTGYLALFGAFCPAIFVLAFLNNNVELRSDAIKTLHCVQRPLLRGAPGLGIWQPALGVISLLGLVNHCVCIGIWLAQNEAAFLPAIPLLAKLAALVALEHALLAARSIAWAIFFPSGPTIAQRLALREGLAGEKTGARSD